MPDIHKETLPWEAYVADARSILSNTDVKNLCRRSPAFVAIHAAMLWAQLIFGWLLALTGPLWALLPALTIIVVCQQSMVLWVHEASHFLLARSRPLNDFLADFLFASPIGMNVETYRNNHLTHHRDLGSIADKDRWTYAFDIHGKRIYAVALVILTGYYGLVVAIRKYGIGLFHGKGSRGSITKYRKIVMTLVWNATLLGFCVLCDRWWAYILLWVYPVLSITVLLNVLRTTAEHQPSAYVGDESLLERRTITRTTIPPLLEKWIFFQANFNYHFEHHVFPGVPCSRLPALHRLLKDRGFYEAHPELIQGSLMMRLARLSS